MNNIAKAVSIKYGLLIAATGIVVSTLTYTLGGGTISTAGGFLVAAVTAVTWLVKIVLLGMSHYEFNKKNNGYISFKHAIVIGLLVIAISHILNLAFSLISYQFFMKETLDQQLENVGGYGVSVSYVQMVLAGSISGILLDIVVLFFVITIEAHWKIYKKAGKEGWAALVPVYSTVVMLDIVGKPAIWLLLLFIPFINIIFGIWMVNLLAKRFGKDEGYTVGLLLLPFVFYPMLGLSEEQMLPEDSMNVQY